METRSKTASSASSHSPEITTPFRNSDSSPRYAASPEEAEAGPACPLQEYSLEGGPSSNGSHFANLRENALLEEFRGVSAQTAEAMLRRPSSIALPPYDGATDIEEYFELFESIATHNRWSDTEKALRLKLAMTGPNRMGLQGTDYQQLKQRLLTQNALSTEAAISTLKALKLRLGDNVYHFADKLQKLVQKAFPEMTECAAERHSMRELIAMLPTNSQIAWLFKAQPPTRLSEAVQRIHESQATGDRKVMTVEASGTDEICSKMMSMMQATHTEMLRQQQEATHQLVKQIAESQQQVIQALALAQQAPPRRPTSTSSPRLCYNCQQPGHLARNCPKRSTEKGSGNSGVQSK